MRVRAYDVAFDVNFAGLRYSATEKIHVESYLGDHRLELDCVDLRVNKVSISGKILEFAQDPDASRLTINDVPIGDDVAIEIVFEGRVKDKLLHGLYKSSYGQDKYIITTDLEPNGARLVLPCVDHPSSKSTFNVEVTVDDDLSVLSNTPVREETHIGGGRKRVVFEKTPMMPAYLFYLGIGRFRETSLESGQVRLVAAATDEEKASKAGFALQNSKRMLEIFEEYFSIPYPLKKLHLIAVPEFPAGAMENWGAITFREFLLFSDHNTSVTNKRNIARVIAHEIAHQWFGDLVTMKWWNDLWLNESFATFMEPKAIDKMYPEWHDWNDFLLTQTGSALHDDSLENTHPIDIKVSKPEEVSEIFDGISYGKGASILRMIESYIGEDAFRNGVSNYLRRFEYSNAEGRDLSASLEESSEQPVTLIMETWVKKAGYPIIEVSSRDGKLRFRQSRFYLDGRTAKDTWPVPLTFTIKDSSRRFLLDEEEGQVDLDRGGSATAPIIVNTGRSGFYRVLYDKELYDDIKSRFGKLSPFDKWGLIDDAYAFLLSGRVEQRVYFELAKNCVSETDYMSVSSVSDQLLSLFLLCPENPDVSEVFRSFYGAQLDRLGLDAKSGEEDDDKILRGRLARGLALAESEFASTLAARFAQYDKLDPNLRSAAAEAFALASRDAEEEAFVRIVQMIKKFGSETETVRLYSGLTAFRDPRILKRALDFSIGGEVNRADSVFALRAISLNREARSTTWEWFQTNKDSLLGLFAGTSGVSQILEEIIPYVGVDRVDEVKDYFSNNPVSHGESGTRKGLEYAQIRTSLRRRLLTFD